MLYSFDYDMSYIPSIPIVEIQIRYAESAPNVSLMAIVDSGADATIIPIQYLQQVQARPGKKAWLRGTVQQRAKVDRYWVWIHLGRHRPMHLQVVGDPQGDEAILGRDGLNQFIVTLNGRASVVEVSD
jgi:hypothetical protein